MNRASSDVTDGELTAFVGGIRRTEQGEVVCDATVSETVNGRGRRIALEERVYRYEIAFRGGVDAGVVIHRADVTGAAALDAQQARVRAARPSFQRLGLGGSACVR